MDMICMENFTFTYAAGTADPARPPAGPACAGINLTVAAGDFLVLCGRSGSGKSTLLRQMKPSIAPAGERSGQARVNLPPGDIAIVRQDPDSQLVLSTVAEDLVFEMENLGYERAHMRKRLAETAAFFGLEALLHRSPRDLSGGQKQLVALCAALMTDPRLLLLDEPAAQLDPIAAQNFMDTLARVHAELEVAVVMTEHRLERALPHANRLVVLAAGRVAAQGEPAAVLEALARGGDEDAAAFIPAIPRFYLYWAKKTGAAPAPLCLTPGDLRRRVVSPAGLPPPAAPEPARPGPQSAGGDLLRVRDVFFAYADSADYVLRNLNFVLAAGERVCLMGGNGAGKSTLLRLLAGALKPLAGRVQRPSAPRVAYLPQNIRAYFRWATVGEELRYSAGGDEGAAQALGAEFGLTPLLDRHPFDLSGGELQKTALCCLLLTGADIFLLDEPTKSLDPYGRDLLATALAGTKTAVVAATHDLEFAADFATRCAMLFDGNIVYTLPPREFFSGNRYYTTPLNLALRHLNAYIVSLRDVVRP
ncbi:MAG: ATP-binding cassette domain-containing protein [Gracilibacteraceae bacterium]|jgi:energy-coupling factor transport system ATP-binding protein|nr:ATP-binding cassette domain-containing protein [Gracilibacteraceae bacterium]